MERINFWRNKFLAIIFLLVSLLAQGKEFKATSFTKASDSYSSLYETRTDLNGDVCALVVVHAQISGLIFDNSIGNVKRDNDCYYVYLSPGIKKISAKCPQYDNLDVYFDSLGNISSLKSAECYDLTLESIDNSSTTELKTLEPDGRKLRINYIQPLLTDISARRNELRDDNGERCALVKIFLPIPNVEFEGAFGTPTFDINEYRIYISPSSEKLIIKCPGYSHISFPFKYLPNGHLEGGTTYRVELDGYNNSLVKLSPKCQDAFTNYDNIVFNKGVLEVYNNVKWGIMDLNGNITIPVGKYNNQYIHIDGNLILVEKNELFGVVNINGNEIIPCKYKEEDIQIHNNLIALCKNELWGIYNSDGVEIHPHKFEDVIYETKFIVTLNNKKGILDGEGNLFTPIIYDYISFSPKNNNFVVEENGKYGILDELYGGYKVPIKFGQICRDGDGWFTVIGTNGKETVLDYNGNKIFGDVPIYSIINSCSAIIEKDGLYGVIDKNGVIILNPGYEWIFNQTTPNGDYLHVSKGSDKGLYTSDGKCVMPVKYADIKLTDSCIIAKQHDGLSRLYTINGVLKWEKPYNDIKHLGTDIFMVSNGNKYALFNSEGSQLSDYKYNFSWPTFKNGLCSVNINDMWGIINAQGQEVIPCIYDEYINFENGLAKIKKNGRRGYMNIMGEEIWFGSN